jgi:predicted heme/steroid binding protein
MPNYTAEQVAEHNKESDCWIIVHGKVYDVTPFLNEHPGGKKVLVKVAGKDASKQFDQFHNKAILDKWGPQLHVGDIGTANAEEATEEPLEGLEQGELFGDMVPFGDPYWYSDWYSPYYDESHRRVRAVVRKWVEKNVTPYCYEWDESKVI